MKFLLLGSAVGIAMISANAAYAQTAAPADDAESTGGLEEIVVTAQKRAESAQDVPIAISAFSGEALSEGGVSALPQLATLVPGLQFQTVGSSAVPFLRGVGATATVIGAEAATATYIDGVYVPNQSLGMMSLPNVASVSVSKGPQGTLFGRNATAGVINITTTRPSQETSGKLSLGFGNFDTFEGSLYATTGLTENVAIDITGYVNTQTDGWGTNLTDGSDTYKNSDYLVRSRLLLTPGENTEINLIGGYERIKSTIGFATRMPAPGEFGQNERGFQTGFQFTDGFYDLRINESDSGAITKSFNASVNFLQRLGSVDFRSISAYTDTKSDAVVDFDLVQLQLARIELDYTDKVFTQEFQLSSAEESHSSLKWIVGAFYYHQKGGYPGLTQFGAGVPGTSATNRLTLTSTQVTNSYSGFAQATLAVSDATNVTLGGRYSSDRRCLDLFQFLGTTTVRDQDECATFNKFTYRAAVDHHFSKDVMVYAQASRGFKSGFYNSQTPQSATTTAPNDPLPVRPETLDAYEIGLKSEFADRTVRFNISGFYYKYKDLQVNAFVNATTRVILNAARARIYGIDADLAVVPTTGLTLTAAASILDAKYQDFPGGPAFTVRTAAPFGLAAVQTNLAGRRLPNAPKFTGSLTAAYEAPLGGGTLNMSSTLYYNGGYFFDPENRLEEGNYGLLSGQIGWKSDGGLSVGVWGRNLTGHKYHATASPLVFGDSITPAAPRTYGIRVGIEF
jgi:iron complex outermembrane recepter protein